MLTTALFLLMLGQAPQPQKTTVAGQPPAKRTTAGDEEKKILKHRELLETLELLQHFEQIRFFDLFTQNAKDSIKGTPASKTPAKENAEKPIRR